MKIIIALSLLSSTSAFTQFLGKKAIKVKELTDNRPRYDPFGLYPKDAPERKAGLINPLETTPKAQGPVKDPLNIYQSKSEVDTETEMSASLPFLKRPELLDGTLPGDRGFDPLGFASSEAALQWQRTAEIKHARIAMLAAVGWPLSELFDKKFAASLGLEPLLNSGDRVPSVLNGGLSSTSLVFWAATLGVAAAIESLGLLKESNAKLAGGSYTPGDLGFDPFNFKALTKEGRMYEAEGELLNGRLAMLGVTGFALQEWVTQTGVVNETPFFFTNPF